MDAARANHRAMTNRLKIVAIVLAATVVTPAAAAELVRKATLAVRMAPPPQGVAGVQIAETFPQGTAQAIGMKTGDVVTSADGQPIRASGDMAAYAASKRAGDAVSFTVLRDGKTVKLGGKALPRPFETYAGATVTYGQIPFAGGLLRDIMVMPKGVPTPPVLFLIQGFSCASIEPAIASDPYRQLGEELVKRGIAYYRVEKPGMGDSSGPLACTDIDLITETDSFRAAYRHIIDDKGIDPDRIFMFGHSLGGIEAPVLAAERPPRGVAAYGTVLKNWADYHLDIGRIQSFLLAGADPASTFAATEQNRDLFRRFYFNNETPAALAAANPAYGPAMRELFNWDGQDKMFGRNFRYMQQIAHVPLAAAWRGTKSNVMALYGETDIVAINSEDHRLIADIANFFRPGSGRFVEVPATGHGMDLIGNRSEYREKMIATGGNPGSSPFNPQVAVELANWIKSSMARPPVRLQADRQLPQPPAG